ncbi:MAG: hypothetical protein JXK93_12965 [Sphaerochaetaceae bacterium]|nr:hypothetical protein [Sphaerochaetaceae bacterium]
MAEEIDEGLCQNQDIGPLFTERDGTFSADDFECSEYGIGVRGGSNEPVIVGK